MSFLFHKKPNLAIDINDADIRIVQLSSDEKIEQAVSLELPEHAFQKDRIVNGEAIAKVLTEGLKTLKNIPSGVVLSIPDSQCFIHTFIISAQIPKDQIESTIIAEASRIIPVDHSEVVFDYVVKESAELGNTVSVFYVSTLRSTVDNYVALAKASGLMLTALGSDGQALGRALLPVTLDNKTATGSIIVTIGDGITTINVFSANNRLMVSSTVPYSAGYFTKSIVNSLRVLVADKSGTVPQLNLQMSDPDRETVLQMALKSIVQEIKTAAAYATDMFKISVGSIVLAGELAVIPDINTYFSSLLGIATTIGDPMQNILKGQTFPGKESPVLFSAAIGLGLPDSESDYRMVNLLKEQASVKREEVKKIDQVVTPVQETTEVSSLSKKIMAGIFITAAFGGLGYVLYEYLIKPLMGA